MFVLDNSLQQDTCIGVVSRLFERIPDGEMTMVTKSHVFQHGPENFKLGLCENYNIFIHIEFNQVQCAPILSGVVQPIACVNKSRKDFANRDI